MSSQSYYALVIDHFLPLRVTAVYGLQRRTMTIRSNLMLIILHHAFTWHVICDWLSLYVVFSILNSLSGGTLLSTRVAV